MLQNFNGRAALVLKNPVCWILIWVYKHYSICTVNEVFRSSLQAHADRYTKSYEIKFYTVQGKILVEFELLWINQKLLVHLGFEPESK